MTALVLNPDLEQALQRIEAAEHRYAAERNSDMLYAYDLLIRQIPGLVTDAEITSIPDEIERLVVRLHHLEIVAVTHAQARLNLDDPHRAAIGTATVATTRALRTYLDHAHQLLRLITHADAKPDEHQP